jgi:hypothetical protein
MERNRNPTWRGNRYTTYGTLADNNQCKSCSPKAFVEPYLVTVTTMLLLWIAQCIFWVGFIRLSSELYVHMCTLYVSAS